MIALESLVQGGLALTAKHLRGLPQRTQSWRTLSGAGLNLEVDPAG